MYFDFLMIFKLCPGICISSYFLKICPTLRAFCGIIDKERMKEMSYSLQSHIKKIASAHFVISQNIFRGPVVLKTPNIYPTLRLSYVAMNWSQDRVFIILTHLPPGQDGRHFADDIFKCVSVNETLCILIKISLKFVPDGPVDNNPALF